MGVTNTATLNMAETGAKKRKIDCVADVFTRSKHENTCFDWKNCCFVCGKKVYEKKRGTVSFVQSGINSSSGMYSTMLKAANKLNDNEMIARLSGINGDLVAVEARYHRQQFCYRNYTKILKETKCETQTDPKLKIIKALKEKLHNAIELGEIFELNSLKEMYLEMIKENDIAAEDIDNRQFTNILERYWPELRIVKRGDRGKTPLVCSKTVDIDVAVTHAFSLNESLNESVQEEIDFSESTIETEDETSILHKAAAILREKLSSVQKLNKEFYSSDEISRDGQLKYIDKTLVKFLGWLKDEKAFTDGVELETDQTLLAIGCDVMCMATGVSTPKHLGLAVHLHHMYGSRKLIDEMFQMGYSVSYTELRHFLTSAAVHMSVKQPKTASGALVPNIQKYTDGSPLFVCAGDNWDHNECTPDGKNTTHAMTTMIAVPYSMRSKNKGRIEKLSERTVSPEQLLGFGGLSTTLHYEKPAARPIPILTPPPCSNKGIQLTEPETAKLLRLKDLTYNCKKLGMFCDDRYDGTWSVFQSEAIPDVLNEKTDIVYNPILLAQPTNYDTVYTTLKRSKEQMNALGQQYTPIVFDMGLLTKALEVVWSRSDELSWVIPISGGMHLLMCIFAGTGFLYGDLGLKALLSDSDVFAPKTADRILSGKDFDRGMRAILMIDEVLTTRLLLNFKQWCETGGHNIFSEYNNRLDETDATEFLANKVVPLLTEFRIQGREASPTFAFWDDYLQNVSTPFKLFLNASRHAIFDVYEYSRSLYLPFLFASNRTVYARYMPYLVMAMQRLPPVVRDSFERGHFMTKLSHGQFNSVWIDYCLEVTENKTLKSNGGIIGLTHRDGALGRWFLSRPITAKYSSSFIDPVKADLVKPHHTANVSFKRTYNDAISKMLGLFDQNFLDPFSLQDSPCHLVNIATGISIPAETEVALLNCHVKGRQNLNKFVEDRFIVPEGKECPTRSFYDPLQKVLGLKTVPKKKSRSNDIPINGEEMYIRLLAINSFKKVSLQRVMSFENAPVPLSIFTDEGDMMSGKKADFLHKMEGLVSDKVDEIQPGHCLVIDGMAVVQMMQPSSPKSSYGDMANAFWSYIIHIGRNAFDIHVTFDRYVEDSAKAQTRKRRGDSQLMKTYTIQQDMKIPEWKQALAESNFKRELTRFYTLFMAEFCMEFLSEGKSIFINGAFERKVLHIASNAISYVPGLVTDQEEADTMMLLHARYAYLQGSNTVCILSPDTDVMVLMVHHFYAIGAPYLYFQTGRKSTHTNTQRYVPIHSIVSVLNPEQLDLIIPLYCISGCDTTSFFFGIGKKSVFKLLMKNATQYQGMNCMGNTADITRVQSMTCTRLVGALYGDPDCKSLNQLRTEKVMQNRHVKPRRLPPTDDSLQLHLQRCLLQILIWKNALVPDFTPPPVTEYGYQKDSATGLISPIMMNQSVAAPELLSDMVCSCRDLCEADCVCESLQQPCTVACSCESVTETQFCCRNIYTALANTE